MSTMKRVSVLMGGGSIAAAILAKMADVVAVSNSATTNVTTTANAPKESRKERMARERAESKHRARYSK